MRRAILLALALGVSAAAFSAAPPQAPPAAPRSDQAQAPTASRPAERLEVPPPPFSDGVFPCSACHKGMAVNRTRRVLSDMHTDIVLKHDEEHRWCLDCHDLNDRDSLHLAGGELVPFTESYRLCGQCHGTQYRDWKVGIHGKRTGYWDGHKRYLLCVNCHNPHSPHFARLQPLPPPIRPQFLRSSQLAVTAAATTERSSAPAEKEADHGGHTR
jgi:hypothetical protein